MNEQTTTREEHGLGLAQVKHSGELATAAMAAKAKALVEARYIMAYNRPRNILQARSDILAACQRPAFAEGARYKKPVGGSTIDGFSIRFAEEAIKSMKNIAVESTTIYEDSEKRTVQINVTDLEANVTYGKEVTIAKTVERRALKEGQVPISQRVNSQGKVTYLVEATEDDISNKVGAAESKIIRNCGLRLVPSDILEEAEQAIEKTLESGGKDVGAGIKKITDAFASLNIAVAELEKYLKHAIATISPKELNDLRAIYAAIKDGEASWSDYVGEQGAKSKPDLSAKKAEDKPTIITPTVEPKEVEVKPVVRLQMMIDSIPVSADDFLDFLHSKGITRYKPASLDELEEPMIKIILADNKLIKDLKRQYGPKAAT